MFQVGKIIRMRNKYPGPPTLVVHTIGEGLRKHVNLCFLCSRFNPNDGEAHCSIAQQMHEFSKANGVAFPVVRCATFEPKAGVEVSDSVGGS